MELQHPNRIKKEGKESETKTLTEVMSHLGDIELKVDHLIERIHDSLYRTNNKGRGPEDFQ